MPPALSLSLSLHGLDKRYGDVHAVDAVTLELHGGELHAVVGENGAGKSTLLKMAAGLILPDAGEVRVDGKRLVPHTVREAIRSGIGMVQQHFALVGVFTALENVMLGAEPVDALGRLDVGAARKKAMAVARDVGISLPWDEPVEHLGVGDRQRLEIVRTLVQGSRIVVLDEPTAVLTPGEAEALYITLRQLTGAGKAVVVVTHRLDEVRDHADVASVMRHGRLVSTRTMHDRDEVAMRAITRDIMGEDSPDDLEPRARNFGQVVLDVHDVHHAQALRGVSLTVRAGEIVGVAGVEGNGQRELVQILAGLRAADRGHVRGGTIVTVHEDRHAEGLVLGASVRDNLVLGELASFTSWAGLVDGDAVEREAKSRLDRAHVVPPDLDAVVQGLSGGNQQKVVVGRAVARSGAADVMVFAQPTRGVDLGASRAIHAEIGRMAGAGKAVLVVSADLAELKALADRIVVMRRGRIVADLAPDTPDARIGEAMLGAAS